MNDRERVIEIMGDLNLPPSCYAINGSGSMVMQGVERPKPMGDLDIFCSTRLWFNLLSRQHEYWEADRAPNWSLYTTDPTDPTSRNDPPYLFSIMYGLEVDVFFSWRIRSAGNINVSFIIHNAIEVDGVSCVPLPFILDWKREVGRAKDVDDITSIERHLKI